MKHWHEVYLVQKLMTVALRFSRTVQEEEEAGDKQHGTAVLNMGRESERTERKKVIQVSRSMHE